MAHIFHFKQRVLPGIAGVLIAALSVGATAGVSNHPDSGYTTQMRKAGTEIDVAIKLAVAPVALGPTAIEMTLSSQAKPSNVVLSYSVEGKLRVDTGAPAAVVLDSDGKASVRIPVTVLDHGVHYLNVFVASGDQVSAYSVRIDTGAGQKTNKSSGETPAFTGMPAEEKRRP